jgi:MFS family permease
MCVFFVGIGITAILTSMAGSPLQVGAGLFVIGIFAAIYHLVGLAIVSMKWKNTGMRIAMNGVWGNLGVASAALITWYMIDNGGWRMAFILPGVFSILTGIAYFVLQRDEIRADGAKDKAAKKEAAAPLPADYKALLIRVSAIVFLTTAVSSIIFQSTTFALPKMLDERLQGFAGRLAEMLEPTAATGQSDTVTIIGILAFIVFAVASMAQLVVGKILDKHGQKQVFMTVAAIQIVFFAAMPGLQDGVALAVSLGFMLGAFGQIPINDFMIGKMNSGPAHARIYGVRYIISLTVLAASLPMIAFVHSNWGVDALFLILAAAALVILVAVFTLPKKLPIATG